MSASDSRGPGRPSEEAERFDPRRDGPELAYEHVFGRAPDAGGQAYWMGRLADGSVTREGLIVFFADSPEFRAYTGTA